MVTDKKMDFKKWDDLKEALVFDFYGEPKEFHTVVEKGFARIVVIANKFKKVVCTAMLLKPEDEKIWEYRLKLWGTDTVLVKYVPAFMEREENKIEFNKISRTLANEMVALFENVECGNAMEEFMELGAIPFSINKPEFWLLKYENLYETTKENWTCGRCNNVKGMPCQCKIKSDECVLIEAYEHLSKISDWHRTKKNRK